MTSMSLRMLRQGAITGRPLSSGQVASTAMNIHPRASIQQSSLRTSSLSLCVSLRTSGTAAAAAAAHTTNSKGWGGNNGEEWSWSAATLAAAAVLGGAVSSTNVSSCEMPRDPGFSFSMQKRDALRNAPVILQQAASQQQRQQQQQRQEEETQKSVAEPGKDTTPTATTTTTTTPHNYIEATSPSGSVPGIHKATDLTAEEARLEAAAEEAMKHTGGLKLFSGNGNMALSLEIAKHLGINLGKAQVGRFADGEVNVKIIDNVRGKDVYVVQPTCTPVNDNMMELLLMVSTLRRASARRITVVIPYYGYARQDRKMQARVPISAADVARLMEAMGVDRVIAVDLHCGQIQGFFGPRVPVDNLEGGVVGIDYFGSKDLHNPVIVSPDAGGVYRAKKFKEGLENKYDMNDIGLAMIIKQRARAGTVDQMDLVGDVTDCDCIIVDDMIDTAGTLCKAADTLIARGARRVFAFASHGLLSGPGNERIANSKMEEVVILNTIPSTPQRNANEKLSELSVAPLLAQTIFNIHARKSVSALFK